MLGFVSLIHVRDSIFRILCNIMLKFGHGKFFVCGRELMKSVESGGRLSLPYMMIKMMVWIIVSTVRI